MSAGISRSSSTGRLRATDCDIADFVELVEQPTDPARFPNAESIVDEVTIYRADDLRSKITAGHEANPIAATTVETIRAELADAMLNGPGIVVIKGAVAPGPVDRVTDEFLAMVDDERVAGTAGGDHFAKPGANDRVWNALEKLAVRNPEAFADYYGNDMIALASEAWLGPAYQITSQVNIVNPGGEAQQPHRDYHLGFMTTGEAEQFPAHIHRLSPLLTLQAAVAHCEMPVESGPTLYLPNSQKYEAGYLAWRNPEFIEYFADNRVQLPLEKGDAVFFNPALFHAAGSNHTADVRRVANLMQVSSALGRAMEHVDRRAMCLALHPVLVERLDRGADVEELHRVIAASAEGYAFPSSLDYEQPTDGLTPASQAALARLALTERWPVGELSAALDTYGRGRPA
jgi:ectoine hydroxylase-related dioxygenase (phytanoyl-CoA dioxygenase family)